MGVQCQILLEKAKEGVFRPGEYVVGTLKYFLDEPTRIGSIDVEFVGKGLCEWSEKDSDDKTTYYRNEEEYVKLYKNVFIAREPQDFIQSGVFEYPFEFLIPDDIPTSIKNPTCTIEYKVIVKFIKENLFETKYKFDAEVPVYGYVSPCSPEPLIFGLQKDLFSLTSKNHINVKAELERTFVTPGENITLRLTVNNDSDVPITIKTELIKYFTYVADNNYSKNIEIECFKSTKGYSPIIKERTVSNFNSVVPTLPSLYSIQHTKILIGEYKVRVTAKVPFPHINARVEVPVVIGERKDHLGLIVAGRDDGKSSPSKTLEEDGINMEKEKTEALEKFDDKHMTY